MIKTALISGCTGQDGSYLAEFLLKKGYIVHGIKRRMSHSTRIIELLPKEIILHDGDLSDTGSIERIIAEVKPHELYNLGAQSDVRKSFDMPEYTLDINAIGVLRILEGIRKHSPTTKVYQASTSEMFGEVLETPQTELTPFNPVSPYGISKLAAHYLIKYYRKTYGIFACSGILFNHESCRRGDNFVTKKIINAVKAIKAGTQDKLVLGNIDSSRDWGYAPEYVEAMWRMLQQKTPDDFVIATGETHTVREFLIEAFSQVGLDWTKYVIYDDKQLQRPHDVQLLKGDYSKAKEKLLWEPKVKFAELIKIMLEDKE
jgi:GDPmannose 4,6-dehydratase